MTSIVCEFDRQNDYVKFTWSQGKDAFKPYRLVGGSFRRLEKEIKKVREALVALVGECHAGGSGDTGGAVVRVREAGHELAAAGFALYERFFSPNADDSEQVRLAADARRWLEQLSAEESEVTLEILSEKVGYVPWNALYGRAPNRAAFLAGDAAAWQAFWGLRYNLAAGRRVEPLRRVRFPRDPRVLLAIDDRVLSKLPSEQQERLRTVAAKWNLPMVQTKTELERELRASPLHLLYWLCHARPTALNLGEDEFSPDDLFDLLEGGGATRNALVFLNACRTAQEEDGESVFGAVCEAGLIGLIATEEQTIDQFAHPLGLDFLEGFLEGEPVGTLLRRLAARR
jgi:hypothetical protein